MGTAQYEHSISGVIVSHPLVTLHVSLVSTRLQPYMSHSCPPAYNPTCLTRVHPLIALHVSLVSTRL